MGLNVSNRLTIHRQEWGIATRPCVDLSHRVVNVGVLRVRVGLALRVADMGVLPVRGCGVVSARQCVYC